MEKLVAQTMHVWWLLPLLAKCAKAAVSSERGLRAEQSSNDGQSGSGGGLRENRHGSRESARTSVKLGVSKGHSELTSHLAVTRDQNCSCGQAIESCGNSIVGLGRREAVWALRMRDWLLALGAWTNSLSLLGAAAAQKRKGSAVSGPMAPDCSVAHPSGQMVRDAQDINGAITERVMDQT